jgi:hypothetical protein
LYNNNDKLLLFINTRLLFWVGMYKIMLDTITIPAMRFPIPNKQFILYAYLSITIGSNIGTVLCELFN